MYKESGDRWNIIIYRDEETKKTKDDENKNENVD